MQRGLRRILVTAAISLPALGCAPEDVPAPRGPVGRLAAAAAADAGVPVDLVLAVAEIEGGLRLRWHRDAHVDDLVPVAGLFEIRHGAFDSLGRGAALSGRSELDLVADLEAGTFAGAAVVAELGRRHGADASLASWAPVLEELSGHAQPAAREDYRARVLSLLRRGGELSARDGERIALGAHRDVPLDLTLTYPAVAPLGTPDYAGATWIDTSCDGKCNTSRNAPIEMVAIHDTEGGWDASVATLQNDPGKSVHYIVDADGSRVAQFIPESYNGWHVGNSYFNNRMVGIEHVGYSGEDDYQTALYAASAPLVKDIAERNAIALDRSHVVAHQEVPDGVNIPEDSPPCPDSPGDCIASGNYGGSNHHTDPGVYWEWCQFMEMVGGVCKCNDTGSLWNCVHDLSMMNTCKDGAIEIVHCADACVVEPIGTDDHCTPVAEGGGGSGGAGAGAGPGAGGDGGAGGSGAAVAADPADDAEDDGGCAAVGERRAPGGAAAILLLGAAALLVGRRRG